jgi:hypothetical protein
MPDRSTLTTSEVDAMLVATSTSRLMNGKNKVNHLGNVATPTLNMMREKGKTNTTPVRGGYKCHLAGQRGGKAQSVSGRDIHTFESRDTLFDVTFDVGRIHLGDEWVHQQLEEAGVEIDHAAASQTQVDVTKPGWWTKGQQSYEVLLNLAEQKLDALDLNYVQELNELFWLSNVADPKLWKGVASLVSPTSNTSGPVGDKNRSDPLLRHQLMAAVNPADIELKLIQLRRACNKRVQDGTKVNFAVCGETIYDAIVERIFSGSNTVSTTRLTRNIDNAKSEAQALSQKIGIAFPDDAVVIAGVGVLMIEPVFEDLQRKYPGAFDWNKLLMMWNIDHIQFKPTKKKDGARKVHATPYNQNVTRISTYGEYALMADQFDCHGALLIA